MWQVTWHDYAPIGMGRGSHPYGISEHIGYFPAALRVKEKQLRHLIEWETGDDLSGCTSEWYGDRMFLLSFPSGPRSAEYYEVVYIAPLRDPYHKPESRFTGTRTLRSVEKDDDGRVYFREFTAVGDL